jgi:hypothetical protein
MEIRNEIAPVISGGYDRTRNLMGTLRGTMSALNRIAASCVPYAHVNKRVGME